MSVPEIRVPSSYTITICEYAARRFIFVGLYPDEDAAACFILVMFSNVKSSHHVAMNSGQNVTAGLYF